MSKRPSIRVIGARQHNLAGIDVEIPRGLLTVVTGPSGSGKSSLAFDTIYAEGQRRYVESLSAHARLYLEQMPKPEVERIEGLPPTIAIEQRVASAGPRSTVATATEIHDYLRVLFARVGEPRCWKCNASIVRQTTAQMVDGVLSGPPDQRIMVLAPIVSEQRGAHKALLARMLREGFVRARINGEVRLLEEVDALPATRRHTVEIVVDRLTVKPTIAARLAESIETASRLSGGRVLISAELRPGQWSDAAYSSALCCPDHPDVRVPDINVQLFSFNSPYGACEACNGLGTTLSFDRDLIVPNPNLSLRQGAIAAWKQQGRHLSALYTRLIQEFCERFGVLPDIPFRNIAPPTAKILMEGTGEEDEKQYGHRFEGVLPNLKRRWETTDSESAKHRLHAFQSEEPCRACGGARLKPEALGVRIGDCSIADVAKMTVVQAEAFIKEVWDRFSTDQRSNSEQAVVAGPLLNEIGQRLRFLHDVGVDYLTLDRRAASLSGGEWQRIRLATQIGSSLAGVCYVLDEPTIGLHPRDTGRLTGILKKLAELDNTVLVVEHDEQIIAAAAHVLDIGPGAGARGGRVVVAGTLHELTASDESLTGKFLAGRLSIPVPDARRRPDWTQCVELKGLTANNLKNIHARFPLGCFVVVTGVSGSGKSTLVDEVLLRALRRQINRGGPRPGTFEQLVGGELIDRVIEVDQSPIGRTPRSNPATYVGVFGLIRELYARTREAKIRGYGPARFSFNIKGGRCEICEGQGTKRIAMHFLPDVFVTCGACGGTRFNRETLEVRYRGKTIADVLDLRIEEATTFFDNFANIRRRLTALKDVGLGYMTLGQPSNTLSGGEAQRVKLAAELHRGGDGHTLYILDEPTTGLHPADVRHLLHVLNRLVERGHTVVVIEHNLDVIKVADWIIDLGPEGGDAGGRIVAEGTPEQVAQTAGSYTAQALKPRLAGLPPLQGATVNAQVTSST